jgi:hypothetical protein
MYSTFAVFDSRQVDDQFTGSSIDSASGALSELRIPFQSEVAVNSWVVPL